MGLYKGSMNWKPGSSSKTALVGVVNSWQISEVPLALPMGVYSGTRDIGVIGLRSDVSPRS